jgi:hypothetical protein
LFTANDLKGKDKNFKVQSSETTEKVIEDSKVDELEQEKSESKKDSKDLLKRYLQKAKK